MNLNGVGWRKASYSSDNGGNCIEVGVWRKASYSTSNGGACVEVSAHGSGRVPVCLVRDSKDPDGPVLAVTPGAWVAFTGQIKTGALRLG